MAYPGWNNAQYSNASQYAYPGYNANSQQTQQNSQYQQYGQTAAPQIRNPFAPPPTARSGTQYAGPNAQHDPEYDAQIAQWQSAYAPQDPFEKGRKGAGGKSGENPNLTTLGVRQGPAAQGAAAASVESVHDPNVARDEKKKTVVRKGGGESWEDDTLLEWDPTQFRIMVGNLAGEVTDDSLFKAFAAYNPSKARVVRDKRTTKSKGFGFVAFVDGELGFKAAREMLNKYIGSHPVTIQRAKTDVRAVVKKDHKKGGKKGGKGKNDDRKKDDPLRASTGATIEKKAVINPKGYKVLG